MPKRCPAALRWAVLHYAESVRLVRQMGESDELVVLCEYHVLEYLPQMEQLLIEQVLTSFSTTEEREAVLTASGLPDLIEQLRSTERELEG